MVPGLFNITSRVVCAAQFIDGFRGNGKFRNSDLQPVSGYRIIFELDSDVDLPACISKCRPDLDCALLFAAAGPADHELVQPFGDSLEDEAAVEINIGIVHEPAVDG